MRSWRRCSIRRRRRGVERRPVPDWAVVHRELRRPNMTLALLWEEYRSGPGGQDGFGYSWFCDLHRDWAWMAEADVAPGASGW